MKRYFEVPVAPLDSPSIAGQAHCGIMIKHKPKPRTNADVLLDRWAKNTEAMASLMLFHDPITGMIGACGMDGKVFEWFEWIKDAISAQVAYLNSPAEVEK